MRAYEIEVAKGDKVICLEPNFVADTEERVWERVYALSAKYAQAGTRVTVREHNDKVVISIGVAAALKLAGATGAAARGAENPSIAPEQASAP